MTNPKTPSKGGWQAGATGEPLNGPAVHPDPERLAQGRAEYGGAVLAVDEASMIGTVRMEALLRVARELEVARVALVGDTAQLKAVDADLRPEPGVLLSALN